MKKLLQSFLVLLALLIAPLAANAQGIYADVNGDGEVNISDVNAIIEAILGGNVLGDADVNGDGEVNLSDINAVIGSILGDNIPTPPGPDPGVIPEDILAELTASGMNIYSGNEPPILDGTYAMDPIDSIALIGPFNTWLPYDDEERYMIEYDIPSKIILSFLDQEDNYISLLTVPFYDYDGEEEYDPDDISFFEDMSIMGHGNKFTIYTHFLFDFIFPGEEIGMIFSGEVDGQNIKNLQFASYEIIPDITGRQVFIIILGDEDRISYPIDWEPDDFDLPLKINRKSPLMATSKMKNLVKSLFKQ